MTRDWGEWHRAYDDPDSSLSRRLGVVTRMIGEVLDAAPAGDIRALSLCAGDGRDLTAAAAGHPRARDLTGLLVELDPQLAAAAATNARGVSERLTVATADAGDTDSFGAHLPVDLLLLCGIFGNVADDDVRRTIATVPAMCRPGATVLWTRHRRTPDLTPSIRRWFDDCGCTPVELVSPGAGSFAIGHERAPLTTSTEPLPQRLFAFRDDLW